MERNGLIACLPVLVLIVLVMITRRMVESMFVASLLAAILAYGSDFINGYIQMLYAALSNESFQLLLIVACAFGGMITLLEKSGAMFGFQKKMVRLCTGPRKTMVLTWLLGGIVFIDDYLNALAVSVSMKSLSDYYRIPREHLAYTVNCMGACVCVLIPISSWSAFAIGSLGDYGLGAGDYYRAIPYMFYPFCAIVISLLLACRKFPLLGSMKKAYQRVENGGPLLDEGQPVEEIGDVPEEVKKKASIWNFLIPMVCLFAGVLLFDNNIVAGILLALASMLVLYCIKDRMKITVFTDHFVNGVTGMVPLLLAVMLGFAMQDAVADMGFNEFVLSLCSENILPQILPAVIFLLVGLAAFLAASFWMLIVITFPIFIPLAQVMGIDPSLIIAAVMSGVAMGSQACIYSDAIFMVASGTGVSNGNQFRSIIPYIGIGVVAATVLFLIAGFLQ